MLKIHFTALCLVIGLSIIPGAKALCQIMDSSKAPFPTEDIPDSLKHDANTVVRYLSDEVLLKGPGKATIKHRSFVTILNEKGDRNALIEYLYNRKYDTYSYIDIRVYDKNGKTLKKYRRGDMYDGAAISDETLASDERILGLRHAIADYPVTVEESYEEDISSFISPPDWIIQTSREQAVQHAKLQITVDPAADFKYECKNIALTPIKTSDGPLLTYTWEVKNLKPIKKEENSMPWRLIPSIRYAVGSFNCFGYAGNLSTWQQFGNWIKGLNSDVCTLSDARIAEIKKMTDTIKSDKAKARFLYKYMQQSMRYVSIQLGIGGYKPFAATFVDNKKYGDCKALSNYMRALLKAADIPSYYTLVKAGENGEPADAAFPYNNFNHVILCVPFKNDTTWLECTSNTQPFGQLGPFTENRNALLITEDGGKLVNTPRSTARANQFNSEVHVVLDADGGAKAHAKITTTGELRSFFVDELPTLKTDEQKERMIKMFGLKQPSQFDFQQGSDLNYNKEMTLDLEYDKFSDVIAGDKQFLRPRVLAFWEGSVPIEDKRIADYYFDFPMQESCVTTIDLPAGYEVESLPTNSDLKFSYGNYDLSFVYDKDKNQVVSTAKFVLSNQVIPASKYTEMQQYFDTIAKAQNKKLVIKKKA